MVSLKKLSSKYTSIKICSHQKYTKVFLTCYPKNIMLSRITMYVHFLLWIANGHAMHVFITNQVFVYDGQEAIVYVNSEVNPSLCQSPYMESVNIFIMVAKVINV